jgi:hypothetical protein
MWTLEPEHSPSDIMTTMSTMPIFNSIFHHFSSFFSDFMRTRKRFFKSVYLCLVVLKTIVIAKLSSKPILLQPSNPCRFLMGKLMGYMLKYCRNHNIFLICFISSRGRQKTPNCIPDAHFGVCLHVLANSFDPSQTKKFVVSAFFITKDCSVSF